MLIDWPRLADVDELLSQGRFSPISLFVNFAPDHNYAPNDLIKHQDFHFLFFNMNFGLLIEVDFLLVVYTHGLKRLYNKSGLK